MLELSWLKLVKFVSLCEVIDLTDKKVWIYINILFLRHHYQVEGFVIASITVILLLGI